MHYVTSPAGSLLKFRKEHRNLVCCDVIVDVVNRTSSFRQQLVARRRTWRHPRAVGRVAQRSSLNGGTSRPASPGAFSRSSVARRGQFRVLTCGVGRSGCHAVTVQFRNAHSTLPRSRASSTQFILIRNKLSPAHPRLRHDDYRRHVQKSRPNLPGSAVLSASCVQIGTPSPSIWMAIRVF